MTKYILGEDQHPHKMTLIVYHLHKHKLCADSRVTLWPATDAHQCHISAALSTTYLEEPGHMPSVDQQSM